MDKKRALVLQINDFITKFKSVPTQSTLTKDGKLTPQEFVVAGDALILMSKDWSWSSCKEPDKNLPKDKQFLISRNVFSSTRASEINQKMADEEQDGEWNIAGTSLAEAADDLSGSDDVDDIDDIDDIDDEPKEKPQKKSNYRKYNILLTYDFRYNSPHIYLQGFDSNGKPLNFEEMKADVSESHVGETVTYDECKQIGALCLGIHPCKHSYLMHQFIQQTEKPNEFVAPQYFYLFLRLINVVIPTIDLSTPDISF